MTQDMHATKLEKITAAGEVYLASDDARVIETAGLAQDRSATFIYWDGDAREQVTGTVISSYRDASGLHFSVRPEIPGAHAI
jgi:hypothetical protein